jgi:hypothetical protein
VLGIGVRVSFPDCETGAVGVALRRTVVRNEKHEGKRRMAA